MPSAPIDLRTQGWSPFVDAEGNAQGGLDVTIKRLDGVQALAAETETDGTLDAALPAGVYDVTVLGETRRVQVPEGDPLGWTSILTYGASPDATAAENATAIRACVAQVILDGGGTVYVPAGRFDVDTTAGPVISIGPGVPVRVIGAGMGSIVGLGLTTLRRTAGTNPVISAVGTGSTDSLRAHIELYDLEVNGNGTTGKLVTIQRANESHFDRLKVKNAVGTGLELLECWNCSAGALYVQVCGNGVGTPAMLMSAPAGLSSSETFHIASIEFESNSGTDLRLSGDVGSGHPLNDCHFGLIKFEGGNVGGGGSPYPYLDFDYARRCSFNSIGISVHGGRSVAPIQQNTQEPGTRSNNIGILNIDNGANDTFLDGILLGKGSLQIGQFNVIGAANGPSRAVVRLESTLGAGRFRLGSIVTNLDNSPGTAKIVDDQRGLPSVVAAAALNLPVFEPVVKVTGNTDITSIQAQRPGAIVTLIFLGTPTLTNGSNLKLGADFVATADDAITLVSTGIDWYRASAGAAN